MRTLMLLVCGLMACTTDPGGGSGLASGQIVVGGAHDDGTGYVDWHGATVSPPIVMGPQGGQHIWTSLQTDRVFNPTKMRLTIDMTDLDTGEVVKPGSIPVTRTLEDTGSVLLVSGITAYVKEPCKIMGHRVEVRIHAEDLVGLTGDDKAVIRPTWNGYCPP